MDIKQLEEREAELVDALMSTINEWISCRQALKVPNTDIDFHVARALLRVVKLSGPPKHTAIDRETMRVLTEYDKPGKPQGEFEGQDYADPPRP